MKRQFSEKEEGRRCVAKLRAASNKTAAPLSKACSSPGEVSCRTDGDCWRRRGSLLHLVALGLRVLVRAQFEATVGVSLRVRRHGSGAALGGAQGAEVERLLLGLHQDLVRQQLCTDKKSEGGQSAGETT